MFQCWDPEPKKRPTFEDLIEDVNAVITSMEHIQQRQVGLNVTYVNVPTKQSYLYPEHRTGSMTTIV